jgi:hypothetical protein
MHYAVNAIVYICMDRRQNAFSVRLTRITEAYDVYSYLCNCTVVKKEIKVINNNSGVTAVTFIVNAYSEQLIKRTSYTYQNKMSEKLFWSILFIFHIVIKVIYTMTHDDGSFYALYSLLVYGPYTRNMGDGCTHIIIHIHHIYLYDNV